MKPKLMSKQVTIGMPTLVATILSLLAGAAQVAMVVLPVPTVWREMGVVVLVLFAGVGINPLVGHAFYAMLKLSPGLANLISAVLAAMSTAATTLPLTHLQQSIILGFLTFAAGLGFQAVSPVSSGGIAAPAPQPPELAVESPHAPPVPPQPPVQPPSTGFIT